jgi:hypothetical protein
MNLTRMIIDRGTQALLALSSACILLLAGCRDLGEEVALTGPGTGGPPPGPVISFRNQVLPIFIQYGCFQCHGGTNGLVTSTPADLLRGGIHGPAIIPGNASGSLIMGKTSITPPFGDRMPQGGPYLPDSTRNIIRDWINQGAKDN